MITTLRIKKEYENSCDLAIKWFSIISILNDFKWAPMHIKILAFTAVKGDISSGGRRKMFCEMFDSTKASIANSITDLYKGHFLIKEGGKVKVHPQLVLNFENDISIRLNLIHG